MHRILERQIKKTFGEDLTIPPQWQVFFELVSDTYSHFDEDRALLDRSLEISSKEFFENSQRLQLVKDELEKRIIERTEDLQKYQTLVNNLSAGVYRNTPGPGGHFLEANPAIVSMFEAVSKEEFMKHNVSDLYADPSKRQSFVEKILRNGFIKNEELDLVTLKGKKIICSVSAVMRKNQDGTIYFDGLIEDITERRKTEELLKRSHDDLEIKVKERTQDLDEQVVELEKVRRAMTNLLEDLEEQKKKSESLAKDLEKFKLAVDNVSDNIIITDPEGTVIYCNKAVEIMTGYKPEEAIGKKSGALWKSPMPPEYYQKMWDTIKNQKKVFSSEIQNKRKSGEIYTAVIGISPIIGKDGEIEFFVGIEHDISKEKEIDRAKSEFVSLASHQLRTPLSIVSWYVEMLLAGDAGVLNEQQKKYLTEAYRGNKRMTQLVDAFLNTSRLELGTFIVKLEPTNVALLARSVVDEQKLEIDKRKIQLFATFGDSTSLVQADPKLLRIVLQNLLSNSVKYTPDNGTIKLSIQSDEKNLLITVADSGLGIPKAQQDKIFNKLFRADNVQAKDAEGTGLGLYIVKSVIDHSGGTIRFESEENRGTTFYVTIPVSTMLKKSQVNAAGPVPIGEVPGSIQYKV